MNALVLRCLLYSSVIINSIGQSLLVVLEKHPTWAVQSAYNRKNFYSTDIKIEHRIFPVRYFLGKKVFYCFWKLPNYLLPGFRCCNLPTDKICINDRKQTLRCKLTRETTILDKRFINRLATSGTPSYALNL